MHAEFGMTFHGGLPNSTWPKPFVRSGPYPNLYRDEQRRKRQDLVFAYSDFTVNINRVRDDERKYDQLEGGLRRPLELPWNYLAKIEDEDNIDILSSNDAPWARLILPFTEKRSHVRLCGMREAVYVPSIRPYITLPSYTGNFIYNVYSSFTRPDAKFIKETQELPENVKICIQALMKWMLNMEKADYQVNSMILYNDLINMKFFPSDFRSKFIGFLGRIIKKQKNLETFAFENAFLPMMEAVQLLLEISHAVGDSLEELHLTNLYYPEVVPQTEDKEPVIATKVRKNSGQDSDDDSLIHLSTILNRPVETANVSDLETTRVQDYFVYSFRNLSNLATLSINYSWLANDGGLPLLSLECIRNGLLQTLILLMMPSEYPENQKQIINSLSWTYALRLCPKLELHLIIPDHDLSNFDFKNIIVRRMPLSAILLGNLYPNEGVRDRKPWFSYAMRYLRTNFLQTLKMVKINVWHPTCREDLAITKLLLGCPYLQVFVYRGEMEKLDTIYTICDFLVSDENITRIREIGLYVLDDPCRPKGWNEAMAEAKEKYRSLCDEKNITLNLGVWRL